MAGKRGLWITAGLGALGIWYCLVVFVFPKTVCGPTLAQHAIIRQNLQVLAKFCQERSRTTDELGTYCSGMNWSGSGVRYAIGYERHQGYWVLTAAPENRWVYVSSLPMRLAFLDFRKIQCSTFVVDTAKNPSPVEER